MIEIETGELFTAATHLLTAGLSIAGALIVRRIPTWIDRARHQAESQKLDAQTRTADTEREAATAELVATLQRQVLELWAVTGAQQQQIVELRATVAAQGQEIAQERAGRLSAETRLAELERRLEVAS